MVQKWLAVWMLIAASSVSPAADVTLSWQGTVTQTSTLGSSYGVQVGDDAIGSITYDPTNFRVNSFFQSLLPVGTGYLNSPTPSLPLTSSLVGTVSFPTKTVAGVTLGILVGDNIANPVSNGFVPGYPGLADVVVFWGGVADPLDANALTIFALLLLDHSATAFNNESIPAISDLTSFDQAIYYIDRSGVVSGPPEITVSVAIPEMSSLGLMMPVASAGSLFLIVVRRRVRRTQ